MKIAAYLTICEEDAWLVPQWLAEVERLDIDFAVHFDRCSTTTKKPFTYHPRCTGYTSQDDPKREYSEHDKQRAFDIIVHNGYEWALHLDADETLEKEGPAKMRLVIAEHGKTGVDCIALRYLSLWEDAKHIRIDGPFGNGYHVKLYNLTDERKWLFSNPTVNGAYIQGRHRNCYQEKKCDLVCLNHGAMTHELRVLHKERWDRIYGAVSGNPYGFWNYSLDYEKYPPVIMENPYL